MLVCEDAVGYRMLMRRWLEDAGVEVVGEATSWQEAAEIAREPQRKGSQKPASVRHRQSRSKAKAARQARKKARKR